MSRFETVRRIRGSLASLLFGAALMAVAVVAFAQDFTKIEIKTTQVAEGIYMLEGGGGNIGVCVGPDGVVLIDDQYAPMSDKVRAAVAKISDKPIRFIINTHWHSDHVGGNQAMGEAGAVIVAHENVRRRMSAGQFSKMFNDSIKASPHVALPVVTFASDVTLHLNGHTISVVHVEPAHTDGDAYVWFKEANVLHTGDLLFSGMYPFVDVESNGSSAGMVAAEDKMYAAIDATTKVIPGHGPLADRAAMKAARDMIVGTRTKVAELIKAGKTKDQILAAKPSAAWDAVWGNGFAKPDFYVGMLYEELSRKK